MAAVDKKLANAAVNLDLVTTSKGIAEPFESAYQWLKRSNKDLHSQETVGTIAFTSNGECKIYHMTWSELVEVHSAYRRLERVEKLLKDRDARPGAELQ